MVKGRLYGLGSLLSPPPPRARVLLALPDPGPVTVRITRTLVLALALALALTLSRYPTLASANDLVRFPPLSLLRHLCLLATDATVAAVAAEAAAEGGYPADDAASARMVAVGAREPTRTLTSTRVLTLTHAPTLTPEP